MKGTVHVCREGHFDPEEEELSACTHVSVFVNDADHTYLSDNDIRGFLDGRFHWGWNQESQSYVRAGRFHSRMRPPKYGEDELFRVLQRWSGIELPEGSRIRDARLSLCATAPMDRDRTFFLYAVRRDWQPGSGGIRGDNVSVPHEGEVWWNEARHGRESWGLPGAGFAAGEHPESDTDVSPLAVVRCSAGTQRMEIAGDPFTRYVGHRLESGLPLLFLLKLADREEDEPQSLVQICSGEYGDDWNEEARPRLRLAWSPPPGWSCRREEVFLEYGRRTTLPSVDLPSGRRAWVSVVPDDGFEAPAVFGGDPSSGKDFRKIGHLSGGSVGSHSGELELEVVAGRRPIPLGGSFSSRIRDTWVVSAPPEDQIVEWQFTSPSGESCSVPGDYEGDWTWGVEFHPDEMGRWSVQWSHELWGPRETGPVVHFDVVAPDLDVVCQELRRLAEGVRADGEGTTTRSVIERLMRLERAGLQSLEPQGFASEPGDRLRAALDDARAAIWGKPIPEEIPFESHPLRHEAGERRFREPIPRNRAFRSEEYGDSENGRSGLSRLIRWGTELLRRLGPGSSTGHAEGGAVKRASGSGRSEEE